MVVISDSSEKNQLEVSFSLNLVGLSQVYLVVIQGYDVENRAAGIGDGAGPAPSGRFDFNSTGAGIKAVARCCNLFPVSFYECAAGSELHEIIFVYRHALAGSVAVDELPNHSPFTVEPDLFLLFFHNAFCISGPEP